jgi:hypothetical protein
MAMIAKAQVGTSPTLVVQVPCEIGSVILNNSSGGLGADESAPDIWVSADDPNVAVGSGERLREGEVIELPCARGMSVWAVADGVPGELTFSWE